MRMPGFGCDDINKEQQNHTLSCDWQCPSASDSHEGLKCTWAFLSLFWISTSASHGTKCVRAIKQIALKQPFMYQTRTGATNVSLILPSDVTSMQFKVTWCLWLTQNVQAINWSHSEGRGVYSPCRGWERAGRVAAGSWASRCSDRAVMRAADSVSEPPRPVLANPESGTPPPATNTFTHTHACTHKKRSTALERLDVISSKH